MNPKVSIIIPIYNVAPYIGACLDSVYNQTYSNIELILVNDCTPDQTMEVAEPYIEKLKERFQVQIYHQKKNCGQSAARNIGVQLATGEYIYFLDSDDEITCDCIMLLANLIEKYPNVDFVTAGVRVIGARWSFPILSQTFLDNNIGILTDYIYGYWNVLPINKLLRKSYIVSNNLWFVEGLVYEDEMYCFQIASTANQMACTQAETYIYKVRQSNSTTALRGFSQYNNLLKINRLIFDYIQAKFDHLSGVPLGRFIVNKVYCFIMEVADAKKLTMEQKINLCGEQLIMLRQMSLFTCKTTERTIRVKQKMLSLPLCVTIYLLRLHHKLISR